jgi:hypothetical protein
MMNSLIKEGCKEQFDGQKIERKIDGKGSHEMALVFDCPLKEGQFRIFKNVLIKEQR